MSPDTILKRQMHTLIGNKQKTLIKDQQLALAQISAVKRILNGTSTLPEEQSTIDIKGGQHFKTNSNVLFDADRDYDWDKWLKWKATGEYDKSEQKSTNTDILSFAHERGAYGKMWAVYLKNDKFALPTTFEVLDGVLQLLAE